MKRFGMILAAVLLAVTAASGQVKFGLKGGVNVTDLSLNSDVFDASNRVGFYAGPILKVGLPITGLGFDIAGLYDQRDIKVNGETISQQSIIVPANVRLDLGLGEAAGIYVAAGPQIGFNIGDDDYSWDDMKTNRENARNTFQMKKSTFSVNLGGGVRFSHFEVGVTYNIAVSNTADVKSFSKVAETVYDNRKAKANAWQVGIAYYF